MLDRDIANVRSELFFHQMIFHFFQKYYKNNMAKETSVQFFAMFELLHSDKQETKTRGKTK